MDIDKDIRVFTPDVHRDERGFLFEAYKQKDLDELVGREVRFVQDTVSVSKRWVLRGLHYQLPDMAQAKLVSVSRGRIFDVAVDIRRSSPTFGEWRTFELSEANRLQLWIPEGFAHGFLALTDDAEMRYKVSDYHSQGHGRAIRWDDHDLGIEWPLAAQDPLLSPRDASGSTLAAADLFE